MVDNVNSFKFGKLSGEFLKNLKTGLKETDLKTEKEIKLFKAIDADKNGVIDKSEIDKLYDALDTSNDGEISKKEAKAYLKENGLEDLKKKDLKNFLNKYVENTEDVANAEVVEGKVQITYKNGTQEIVNSDRSKELINIDEQGNTVRKEVTEDYKLKQETVTAQNGDTKATKYAEDGKTIQQTVEKEVGTNTTTTVNYENGKKSSKKVEKGTTEENYKYEDETEVLDSKIENKGIPAKEKHSKYTYNADKSVTETITEPAANRTTVRTKSETGVVEDITDESGKTHNIYNANNKKLSQTKMVNGKEYSIQYDGAGNTSVIVQNGESVADLAKKFGVTEEEIKNANKELLDKNKKFSVGDEVKIPKEIEADNKALQGRKSSEGAKADYELQKKKEAQAALRRQQAAAQAAAKKAQAAAQEAQYKAAGLINHKGQGTKVTGHYKSGKQETFTVIGEAGNGRKLAKDKNGKLVTVAHDGVILKESYVQASNLYSKGKKIQGKIKDKTGKLVTKEFVEIPGMGKLPHGRKAVVDAKGRTFIMAQDGVVLSDEYIAKSNAADVIRKDSKVAQAQTLDMLESQLSSAEAAFNAQMKQDGWAGDVADGVSVLWGSDNRASKVREDFAKYSNTIKELKAAAQKGDAVFEAKFQEKFGVKYNKSAVADYLMRPTAANYRKAFGTKQSIGERVAKYNESQQAGASIVKAGAEFGAAAALTAATIATGGVAGVVAGMVVAGASTVAADVVVETTDRMSSKEGLKDGQFTEILKDASVDGAIAAATLGTAKGMTAAYKVGKTAYTAGKIASKAATVGEKTVAKATTSAVKMEAGVAKTTTKATTSHLAENVSDTVADVVVSGTAEYIETGDVTLEGVAMNAAVGSIGIVGEKIGGKLKAKFHRSKNEVGATNTAESQGVMHATGDAAHHSGGKLNAEKMENARTEVRDIAQNGTPKEVAKAHQAADYQQVQSRAQGRELKQNIEDASGFVSVGKERIALDSSNLDDLAKAKKAVEGWSDGTRDKEAILAKIDTRMNEIKAGQVNPTEPARASEIVDEINTSVNKTSERIMEDKTGAIGSHDAATLRDNLVNNVKTEEDVEKFIADIKNRVGVDDKGNMHVYQVQGKDHAADLVNQAETKLKSIRANKADMQQITTTLDDAISSNKGLSEDSLKSIRAFSAKSNSVEDLQNIIDKMNNNNIKKSSAQKKLIRDMQDKVDILKAKQSATNVVTAEPKKAQVADDGKTADFTTEQQRIYQEEMQAVKEAPAPAQKPQETAPQPVEVKPENNNVQNNTNKINNNNEAVQKPAVEKAQNNAVENKPVQSTSEKPVSGQKMDSVKSTQTTKAHIKQVIKDLPDNLKQSFVSIYNEISNLTSMVNVAAIRKKISAKFSKYAEALNSLTDRLEAKISSLKNSLNKLEDIGSDILDDSTKGISSMGSKLTNTKAQQLDLDLGTNIVKKKVKTPYDNLIPKDPQAVKNIANYYHADVVDVNKSTKHFKKGDRFVLDLATNKHAQISLGGIMSIDLSEPRLAKQLMNLKEGESITIGSFEGHATYRIGSSANGVSHEHLIVTKQNGVYVFKDTSTFGTHISKNSAEPIKAKDVQSMFLGNLTKGSYYMSKVHNGSINLTSEDYQNIAKLMNKCDGKYRKLWESTFLLDNGRNIDKLAAFENLIRKHGTFDYYLNLDDKTWAVVVENICQKHETAVGAISNYKASSNAINSSLSNHYAYNAQIAQDINNMTKYLNTQTINKHIKVYRGEQYNGSLSLLKFPNGMSVGQAMENLIKKGASQQEIKSFVNKYLIGTKFKQERFMSTALNKQFCEDWAKSNAMGHSGSNPYGSVVWEIDVPGETKGAFVEDFNTFYGEEYEVILQRESSLIINGTYFDKAKNQWVIQAKVKQTPYNEIQKY